MEVDPAKRWTRKCRVSGAEREVAKDVSIRNVFCSVPFCARLFPSFYLTPQTLFSLTYGAGCALLMVRLVWALATHTPRRCCFRPKE